MDVVECEDEEAELIPDGAEGSGPMSQPVPPAAQPPAAGPQAPAGAGEPDAFWSRMDSMLDKKMSVFGQDVVAAMNALEARVGTQITTEREERLKSSGETNAKLQEVMDRLQKLEERGASAPEGSAEAPRGAPGGWTPVHMILGFEPNQPREALEERSRKLMAKMGSMAPLCLAPFAPRKFGMTRKTKVKNGELQRAVWEVKKYMLAHPEPGGRSGQRRNAHQRAARRRGR